MNLPKKLPLERTAAISFYEAELQKALAKSEAHYIETQRWLGRNDLFYLLVSIFGRKDVNRDWLFDRCREVQNEPDGMLDLWSREHYKGFSHATPINTPAGLRCHGDLKPGDYVYSPSGEPVLVEAVTGDMVDPETFELTFSTAINNITETLTATSQHLWDVEYFDLRRKGSGRVGWTQATLNTKELIERTERQKNNTSPRWYRIRKAGAQVMPHGRYWYLKDIKRREPATSQCIQVTGGLYVVGMNNIPTHNSTVITYALTIQDIINNPEVTVGIFSHTKGIARGFLKQIKRELETNEKLKALYPEILFENPQKEAPRWSEDGGLIVKRKTNPKEATLEAHGLVDGQPTSKHFSILIYDDVVTLESVTSPDMIIKVTDAWSLSLSLGTEGGVRRHIGTRYHFNDTYKTIMDRTAAKPRIHTATDNGLIDGEPVLMTRESLEEKRRTRGPYIFACQYMQNPAADSTQGFDKDWLFYWPAHHTANLNIYIIVDPASEKKKTSDYSTFFVIGLGDDDIYRVITIVRDRLNLTERANTLFALHKEYQPLAVGYEKYGMQADIEHFKDKMSRENYTFRIKELGGQMPKNDRIKKLVPLFEQERILLPETCMRRNYEGVSQDLTAIFRDDEYLAFPLSAHDDMLDCLARIRDPEFPMRSPMKKKKFAMPKQANSKYKKLRR